MTSSNPDPAAIDPALSETGSGDRAQQAARGLWDLARSHPWGSALLVGIAVWLVQAGAFQNRGFLVPIALALGVGILLRATAQAPVRQAQRGLADLGFTPLELDLDPDEPRPVEAVVQRLVEAGVLRGIRDALEQLERGDRRHLLSIALPPDLDQRQGVGNLQEDLTVVLRRRALDELGAESERHPDELRADLARALAFEVWVPPAGTPGTLWYRFKRLATFRDRAETFLRSKQRSFRQAEEVEPGRWRRRAVDRVAWVGAEELVVGPEEHPTAVIDVVHPRRVGIYPVERLAGDAALRRDLGLDTTRVVGGWPLIRGTTTHQKGFVRFAGFLEGGGSNGGGSDSTWSDAADLTRGQEHQSPLDRTVPNLLLRSPEEAGEAELHPLLADLVSPNPPFVSETVRSRGNFRIFYGPVRPGSEQERYWIEPAADLGDTETRAWWPSLGGPGLHKNPENYRPLAPGESVLLPFSTGYLITGTPSQGRWLCLEVNVGSPGIGTPDGGITRVDTADLRSVVQAHARRLGLEDLRWEEGSHGVIAHGRAPEGGRRWITLCEPRHAERHRIGAALEDLQARGALPPSVEILHLDRHGRPTAPEAGVLTVSAPELPMIAHRLAASPAPSEAEREEHCYRLTELIGRCLAADVVCVDLTLDQAAIAEDGRVFVCDYTAYVPRAFHRRESTKKPEYLAPEEVDGDLPLRSEPFQVFTLGTLFFQILFAEPGEAYFPLPRAFAERDRPGGPAVEAYGRALEAELTERFAGRPEDRAAADLLGRMLAWHPEERPGLAEVRAAFETPPEPDADPGADAEPAATGESEP